MYIYVYVNIGSGSVGALFDVMDCRYVVSGINCGFDAMWCDRSMEYDRWNDKQPL